MVFAWAKLKRRYTCFKLLTIIMRNALTEAQAKCSLRLNASTNRWVFGCAVINEIWWKRCYIRGIWLDHFSLIVPNIFQIAINLAFNSWISSFVSAADNAFSAACLAARSLLISPSYFNWNHLIFELNVLGGRVPTSLIILVSQPFLL